MHGKKKTKKYVIVSNDVKDQITSGKEEFTDVIFSSELKDDITACIKRGGIVFMVIFIHVRDLADIDSYFMKNYNSPEIFYRLVLFGSEKEFSAVTTELLHRVTELRVYGISRIEFNLIVQKAFLQIERLCRHHSQMNEDMDKLIDMKRDQEDLINIGKALSTEKDPDELIKLILQLSKKITGADAGSLYIVEEAEKGKKRLRFKYSHTFSREIPLQEFVMDLNKKSIAGYVAVTGEVLNIPDAYNLPEGAPYSFNKSFDEQNSYICRSMLVVPMKNHIDEIIGVIQLINSKEDPDSTHETTGNEAFSIRLETPEDFQTKVVQFDERYDGLMESVAGQAAIAIENNRMIKQIQNQFEEFVRASVTAVESRDIATSGHSFRVAEICTEMAAAINREKKGHYKDFIFTDNQIKELEYAALLHDFGKVYVDINIFKKAKKLFPKDLYNLHLRLNYMYKFVELGFVLKESGLISEIERGREILSEKEEICRIKEDRLKSLREIREKLVMLNEPTVTEESPKDIFKKIEEEVENILCEDIEGNRVELITDVERLNLQIERGSLNPEERKEIEGHVIHAYNFVSRIPWPPEFKEIPDIVLKHHEKLDGTGYPNGCRGDNISVQSRIMAIADIYDALVASDRPYKKAISVEKALSILKEEVERNKLDKDLFDIFVKNRIYEKTVKKSA